MATSAGELERLVVRLVGEGSDYEKTLDHAVSSTEQASKQISNITDKEMGARNKAMQEGARMTQAAMKPTERYAKELADVSRLYKTGAITSETYNRTIKKLNQTFTQGSYKVVAYGKNIAAAGKKMRNMGMIATLGVTLPIAALGYGFVKAASHAEETQNKFSVVFKSVAGEAKKAAKDLDDSFGMSSVGAQDLLASTGDILTGFGYSGKAALGMSVRVQELAADLASLQEYEGGAARASEALTKLLLGQGEMAQGLGIIIRQDEKEYIDLVKSIQKTTGATRTQAKAEASLQMALIQSKNAIGDYERSHDSLATKTKEMMADLKDLQGMFGKYLIPYAKKAVDVIMELTAKFEALSPGMKKMVLIGGTIAALIGPMLSGIGMMTIGIGGLTKVIGTIGTLTAKASVGLAGVSAPVLLIIAGVVALGFALYKLIEYMYGKGSVGKAFKEMGRIAKIWWLNTVEYIKNIKEHFKDFIDWIPGKWKDMFSAVIATAKKWALSVAGFIVNIKENFKIFIDWLPDKWKDMFSAVIATAKKWWLNTVEYIKNIKEHFNDFIDWIPGKWKNAFSYIIEVTKRWALNVVGFVINIVDNFKIAMDWLGNNWKNLFRDMGTLIGRMYNNAIHNTKVFVDTSFRLYALWQGYMISVWKDVFRGKLVKWVFAGIRKAATAYFDFAEKAREKMMSIFKKDDTAGDDLKEMGMSLKDDFITGLNSEDIFKDAADIVKEQLGKIKSPFDGFESSLDALPKFITSFNTLELPDFSTEIKKAKDAFESSLPTLPEFAMDFGMLKFPDLAPIDVKAKLELDVEEAKGKADEIAAAVGAGQMKSTSDFRQISLKRFNLAGLVGAKPKEKQEVKAQGVEDKLDVLIGQGKKKPSVITA